MNVPVSSPFNQGLRNGLISASRGIRSGGFESSVNIGGAIGFGFVGANSAMKSYDALRNQQYGSAALNAGVAAGAGYAAYHLAFQKASISSVLRAAASRLR